MIPLSGRTTIVSGTAPTASRSRSTYGRVVGKRRRVVAARDNTAYVRTSIADHDERRVDPVHVTASVRGLEQQGARVTSGDDGEGRP